MANSPYEGEGDKGDRVDKMTKEAILVLEDGSVYHGYAFGAEDSTYGEVVFNTSIPGREGLKEPI